MLNIQPKKEVEKAVHDNLERFKRIKMEIFEKNFKRDENIILSDVLPRLHQAIALKNLTYNFEAFHFTLPMLDTEGYTLSEEEKLTIIQAYYHGEKPSWVSDGPFGFIHRAISASPLLADHFDRHISFESCAIQTETHTVQFSLGLKDRLKNGNVKEEQAAIVALIDEAILPHVQFTKIADTINGYYERLKEEGFFILGRRELEFLPILTLNLNDCLKKSDFYATFGLTDTDLEIDIDTYLKQSKILKSLQRKLRKYGYMLHKSAVRLGDRPFYSNGIRLIADASFPSKDAKDESLVKSETLSELFELRRTAYQEVLTKKAKKENEKLIELVETGHFDEMVAKEWVKATLMSTKEITKSEFQGEHRSDVGLYFRFTAPFNRELPRTKVFIDDYNGITGIGNRYMELENNIVDALKKRYPFFENARLFGESSKDFQVREGVFNTDSHQWIPDTLAFGFAVHRTTYIMKKEVILNWLATAYGLLPIDRLLKGIDFDEAGIVKKMEAYVQEHQEGTTSPTNALQVKFEAIHNEQLAELYQQSSLSAKFPELFDAIHEDLFFSYEDSNEGYKAAKKEEFQSLKLANLFVHALYIHPKYTEMKEALNTLGYELKINYKQEEKKRIGTGNTSLYGTEIESDVCKYSVQIVIE